MNIPVVPLLHLTSAASICGIGWTMYAVLSFPVDLRAEQAKITEEVRTLEQRAKTRAPGPRRWDYRGAESEWFWDQLADANFTGAVEKGPTQHGDDGKETPVPTHVDLTELIELACIMHAGDNTGVVVRYLGDVEVPESIRPRSAPTHANPAVPHRLRRASTPTRPVHHLQVGQKLWPPYDYALLTHVAPDASSAIFELRLDTERDADGSFKKQRIQKTHLSWSGFGPDPSKTTSSKTTSSKRVPRKPKSPRPDTPRSRETNEWTDLPIPVMRRSQYELTQRHLDFLGAKAAEHIAVRRYARPSLQGIEVRHLSSHARKFGIEIGDVVLTVNGVAVKNLAAATRLGTRLYRKGVRTIRIVVLRGGREVPLVFALK